MSGNEWYTPARYIEAARAVMGGIDLDPASCALANCVVQATHYYTKEENGLTRPWHGRVWLNPPYGKTQQGQASNLEYFTRYLVEQYDCGNVTEAILLIPVNTATRWFEALWRFPICFPRFRVRFYDERGPSDGASFGTCFVYLGPHQRRFSEVFQRFGHVVLPDKEQPTKLMEREIWNTSVCFESVPRPVCLTPSRKEKR